jgi:hypothetical protein
MDWVLPAIPAGWPPVKCSRFGKGLLNSLKINLNRLERVEFQDIVLEI